MLFGGLTDMGKSFHTLDTSGSIQVTNDTVDLNKELVVKERNILNELDNLHNAMLLLPRDQKLEEKYPELKEAYDAYNELYRGIMIAEKMGTINE
tara:strand:- start:1206 stop:1490 length:285 start_codon:yes stop_codon:yes gene_type:complete